MSFPKYPKYNFTGLTWLSEAPEHWRVIAPKRVMQSCSGGTLIKGECAAEPEEGLFPAFSASGQDVWIERPNYSSPGIVLSAVGARCGKTFKADGEWGVVANTHCLFPGDSENRDFLWYLTNKEDWWEIGGTAQPFVKVKETLSRPWCLPPASEQAAIANFLDHETAKIDALISEQERLIELLQEKRQAVISQAVTKGLNPVAPMKDSGVEWLGEVPENWRITKLSYLISTRKGVAFKSEDFCNEGIPVSKASDIKSLSLREASTYIADEFARKFPKAVIHEGEIIISTVGSNPEVKNSAAGQLCMVPAHSAGNLLNQNTAVFTPLTRNVDNRFLFFSLLSTRYRDHLDLSCHGTANQSSISLSEILDYWVALPPINEQEEIATSLTEELARNNKLSNEGQQMINLLRERRSALISSAVTGQIDVRGLVSEEEAA